MRDMTLGEIVIAIFVLVVSGGLGAAVASVTAQLATASRVPMRILGVNQFAPTGSTAYLLDHFGLNVAGIVAAVKELLSE
jgi:transketolase